MTVIGYHLIDPKQSGLEEKVKAFIRNSELEQTLEHRFVRLETGVLMAQHLDTKLIFSYLSISWRTFPFFRNVARRKSTSKNRACRVCAIRSSEL